MSAMVNLVLLHNLQGRYRHSRQTGLLTVAVAEDKRLGAIGRPRQVVKLGGIPESFVCDLWDANYGHHISMMI